MSTLKPVEGAEVQVLVEDHADPLSSVPDFVETEFYALQRRRAGRWVLGGTAFCSAAHGLSLRVTVRQRGIARSVLFDTGPEDHIFEQNASRLGIDLKDVEAIVLSHGHCDHGGGGAMLRALQLIRDRNGGRNVPYFCHPDTFRKRGFQMPNSSILPLEDVPSIETLTEFGAQVISTKGPQFPLDGLAYVSGEIPRVTPFEVGLPGQFRRTRDNTDWEPDEWVKDERFLAIHVAGKGIIIFTACSHAGVVNVLKHARTCFGDVPLYAVMGGLHLAGYNERIIPETVAALKAFDLRVFAVGHCTGWRAITALANAVGTERLVPLSVGKKFIF